MGHGLDLRVIAEGIETDAQHDRLRGMGCDLGQGYLYAPPLPPEDVTPLLSAAPVPRSLPEFVATAGPDRVIADAWSRLPTVCLLAFDSDLRITMAHGAGLDELPAARLRAISA